MIPLLSLIVGGAFEMIPLLSLIIGGAFDGAFASFLSFN